MMYVYRLRTVITHTRTHMYTYAHTHVRIGAINTLT